MDERQLLKNFLRNISGLPLLNEQDDLFGGEEEEEGGEEEGGDEEGGDEEGGEEEGGDEEEGEEEEEEKEPDPDAGLDDSLDGELNAIFVDIENKAIKKENLGRYSLVRALLREQEEEEEEEKVDVELDVDKFAEETARIFRNVEAFLDVDEIILKKAKEFVSDHHGEERAEELLNILKNRYNIVGKDEKKASEIDVKASVPIAVGASSGGGAV